MIPHSKELEPYHPAAGRIEPKAGAGARAARWCVRRRHELAPGIATTAIAGMARYWHHTGAAGDLADAAIVAGPGALGLGIAYVSAATGANHTITAAGVTTGAACTLASVATYVDAWQGPAILWAISTAIAYAVSSRTWSRRRLEEAETAVQVAHASAIVHRIEAESRAAAALHTAYLHRLHREATRPATLPQQLTPGIEAPRVSELPVLEASVIED